MSDGESATTINNMSMSDGDSAATALYNMSMSDRDQATTVNNICLGEIGQQQ